MSTAVHSAAAPGRPQFNGHNRISTQALISTARAVAAEAFGISPASVRADFSDDEGLLALHLALPLPIPALARVADDAAVLGQFGGPVLDRAAGAKQTILNAVAALSGARLSRVDIRVTGVTVAEGARVQ